MAPPIQKTNPVPLIIFIVLFVFSAVGLVLVAMELAKTKTQMNEGFDASAQNARKYEIMPRLKLTLKQKEELLHAKEEEIERYKRVIGADEAEVKTAMARPEMQALASQLAEAQKNEGSPSLLALIQVLEREKIKLADRLQSALKAAEAEKTQLTGQVNAEAAKVKETQTAVDDRNKEIDRLKEEAAVERAAAKKESEGLRADLEKARGQKDVIERSLTDKIGQQERLIIELQGRLRQQETLKAEGSLFDPDREPADGKVLLVDRDTGIVLDVGRKKGVRPGLRFQVYTLKADGTRIKRGNIEVKTVFPEISRAILVGGDDPTDLVAKDDIIVNPAFDPGKAKIFVADSVFDDAKKQGFREALAEYGSALDDEITARSDYLIIGPQRGKLMDYAEKVGIPMIREDELNAILGR